MDIETIKYLDKLALKAEFYHQTKESAVKYIAEKDVLKNKQLCVNIMLISAVWASTQLDLDLTEDDINLYFGLQSHDDENFFEPFMHLPLEQRSMTLKELQDETVKAFNKN